ncbi:hypothetical protein B0F90DRAFT_1681739, partial [Multifurca ochricompacta]
TTWKNQVFGIEPYEELQTDWDSQPDVLPLTQSHSVMDSIPSSSTQSIKPSKKSFFSRKPVKGSIIAINLSHDHSSTRDTPTEPLDLPGPISKEPSSDVLSPLSPNRSIIPESLKELPSWYHTEGEWAAASTHQFRARYPIHNPVGPRFYRNVHLLPPNRPASVFSPSFPPMSTEPASAPSPSHTPSGSPLPTPNSSQTRILDPSGKVRTRKISNTAHDNVDLLDASDPHGTNWHHQSPYDGLGLSSDRSAVSPDVPDARPPPRSRSRLSSLGAGSHHKTTTPSPLSQSTSAVHLHPPDQDAPPIARKLTKRRKPFEGIFGSSPAAPSDTASVTPSSLAPSTQTVTNTLFKRQSIFKSASTSSIPHTVSNASILPSEKRQKRGSVLGRFARRFSIMRHVTRGHSRGASLDAGNECSRGDTQSLQVTDGASTTPRPVSSAFNAISPSERRQSTRVPPPQDAVLAQDEKRDSTSSLQVPYSIGRLTIANPDAPSSADNSPVNQSLLLPPNKTSPAPAPLSPQGVEHLSAASSIPVFQETLMVDSPIPAAVARTTSGEVDGRKSQPLPLSSAPRASRSSPLSPTSVPVSITLQVATSAPPAINDSPLSRASIIANPPTPYVEPTRIRNSPATGQAAAHPVVHLSIPSPVVTPIPSPTKHQASRQHKSSSSVRSRETETFHLVRSPSAGAMQPTGESIIVEGEQWEVVGERDSRRSHADPERQEGKRQERTTEKVMVLSLSLVHP